MWDTSFSKQKIHATLCTIYNTIGSKMSGHTHVGGANLNITVQCVNISTWAMSNPQLFN